MNLFYLNQHLKVQDKTQIIKDFIDAETQMYSEGDEHPAVINHNHLITLISDRPIAEIKKIIADEYDQHGNYNYSEEGWPEEFYNSIIQLI